MSELFGNQGGKPSTDKPKTEATKEAPKQETPKNETKPSETKPAEPQTQTKPEDHNDPNKVAGSETKPSSAPSSLVPAAPLQGEQPADQNKAAVQQGTQATTNPAQNQTPAQNAQQNAEQGSGGNDDDDADDDLLKGVDELTMLKERAKLMGISHSNNIGVEALREKIAAKINGEDEAEKAQTKEENLADRSNVTGADPETATLILNPQEGKKLTVRQHVIQENMKLVRLRITNLDPKKKDLPGEIITVANEFLGTVRKYIPFGEVTDNGWHVPYCLYEMLRDRQFVNIKTRKGPKGEVIVEHQWAKEFALEVLEPLTQEELARLSASQMAAGGID